MIRPKSPPRLGCIKTVMEPEWDSSKLVNCTAEFRAELNRQLQKQKQRFVRLGAGIAPRLCPLCDYFGNFAPFGVPPRFDARCPSCGSLERHRLTWLVISRRNLITTDHSFLHFSAEPVLRRKIQPAVASYASAELRSDARADLLLNIEAIDLPDASYDRVMCNHVLEHVDDARAIAELYRVLRPGGAVFLTTPIVEGWAETYENPDITDGNARLLHFAQRDHIRIFGRDLRDRIRAVGFLLDEVTATEPDVHRYGLMRGETVFIATKPEGPMS